MNQNNAFEVLLLDIHELEAFLHELISPLAKRHPQPGEDLARYIEELKLTVPKALAGVPIRWAGKADSADEAADEQTIILVRPGIPGAVGLTIGCVHVGRVKVCLECGWIYCRIVIKGRF